MHEIVDSLSDRQLQELLGFARLLSLQGEGEQASVEPRGVAERAGASRAVAEIKELRGEVGKLPAAEILEMIEEGRRH